MHSLRRQTIVVACALLACSVQGSNAKRRDAIQADRIVIVKSARTLTFSYPNAADRVRAAKLGVNPGGDIMIHGVPPAYAYLGALHRQTDWTLGCVAVTDAEIEEIWSLVPNGTTVEIKP